MLKMFGLLIVQVLLNAWGSYRFKVAPAYLSWSFATAFLIFMSGLALWTYLLRAYPFSMMMPLAAAFSTVLGLVIGAVVLGETVQPWQVAGAILIISGIFMVSWKTSV